MTDINWDQVFRLRCKAKSGGGLSPEEQRLVAAAFEADPERYRGMNKDVFEATKPFGATR